MLPQFVGAEAAIEMALVSGFGSHRGSRDPSPAPKIVQWLNCGVWPGGTERTIIAITYLDVLYVSAVVF